jgi:mannose-6-phosphate isomerase
MPKPWGVVDLRPWSEAGQNDRPIGEIWYERVDTRASNSLLLLKLLFTSRPLSIQVHPGDAYAHSIGLLRGKSEAWYILRAAPESKIALGLKEALTSQQLREAIDTGSILDLVQWQSVSPGDTIFVPAGTIHAIGAGVVIAEIQQRSDATFRLFDFGRQRELHKERAIAVAATGPAGIPVSPSQLTDQRRLLTANEHFVLEKIELPPNTAWSLEAERETWLLVVDGDARIGSLDAAIGDVMFVEADRVDIQSGTTGMVGLVAYTGADRAPNLLGRHGRLDLINAGPQGIPVAMPPPATAMATNENLEIIE